VSVLPNLAADTENEDQRHPMLCDRYLAASRIYKIFRHLGNEYDPLAQHGLFLLHASQMTQHATALEREGRRRTAAPGPVVQQRLPAASGDTDETLNIIRIARHNSYGRFLSDFSLSPVFHPYHCRYHLISIPSNPFRSASHHPATSPPRRLVNQRLPRLHA
jgi:hypothetical protein